MNISEMLTRNAELYSDETALIELTPGKALRKEITWQQFEEASNRIANTLRTLGIQKGDRVIQLMRNSNAWLEVYFGILRTGAWVVPLNFRFTSADIKYCADVAEARIMITEDEFTGRVEAIHRELPTMEHFLFHGPNLPHGMESLESLTEASSGKPTGLKIQDDDECGLYFSSGTTGSPKPVLLTHRNMECAAITEYRHHYQQHDDNFILLPPLYHTGAKMHWFGSLVTGSRATLLTEISPKHIFEAVHQEKGTIVWLLVPWAQDILGELDRGELKKEDYDLSQWRLMHIGAQPVPPSLVKRWKDYFPGMQYDTNYGLSESCGPGCVHLGIENEHKVGAIGKAGVGWQTRIVSDKNNRGEDVAPGEIGELIVRGDGIMKEYYKNPEKTAETLKDGWLYTGDMARQDEDGFIYLVDRKKDIVIMGGENVYPVELEDILRAHPSIYDCGVIGLPDARLGEIPAAIIAVKPGMTLTEAEVKAFCEENLPRFKRPRKIIFDAVPRNATGKIEKPKMRQKYTGTKESFKI
ncbi:MAG: AMP-binding protein [Chloroflexota bacterium]